MIERALIRQVVQRAEIAASDAEVDQAIAEHRARERHHAREARSRASRRRACRTRLYRERIRGEIEHAKVLNDVVAAQRARLGRGDPRRSTTSSSRSSRRAARSSTSALIVVTPKGEEPGARATACAQVAEARARVVAGEPFEAVARQVSEANPETGGAQGWVHESQLARWMRARRRGDRAGRRSPSSSSRTSAARVLFVEDRRAFVPLPYEKAKPRLQQRLFDERMRRGVREVRRQAPRADLRRAQGHLRAGADVDAPAPSEGF